LAFLSLITVSPLTSAQARDGIGCQVFAPSTVAGASPWLATITLLRRSPAAIDRKVQDRPVADVAVLVNRSHHVVARRDAD